MATIKEIAKEAGVSIATVSHVINKTRYVSPELAEKVEDVIKKLGYDKKIAVAGNQFRIGKKSEIALLCRVCRERFILSWLPRFQPV
ncbi:hypothetical protein HMSSN036_14320 [Paenibacillus macerans]|nr:hypothetical protein HMSSN036_14320 [Paenibacillus macerans]